MELKIKENTYTPILVEVKKTTVVEKELAMTKDSADKVITALLCLPGGIQKMSFQMKGLVQTSLNLGIMKTEKDHVSHFPYPYSLSACGYLSYPVQMRHSQVPVFSRQKYHIPPLHEVPPQ